MSIGGDFLPVDMFLKNYIESQETKVLRTKGSNRLTNKLSSNRVKLNSGRNFTNGNGTRFKGD